MAGPETAPVNTKRRSRFSLAAIGFAMGVADIIPGVSGGTIAFISGVYEQLLLSIASFDISFIRCLLQGNFKEALGRIQAGFLLPLVMGVGAAILLMSRIIHWLLEHHESQVLGLFMGLIAGSILMIGRKVPDWGVSKLTSFALGFLTAFMLTGIVPVQTPSELWFLFLCGMVAICAMILPGISGAFILLLLGKYHYMTGVLKNPFSVEHLVIILVFMGGCVVGLTGFARILKYWLSRNYGLTMSLLTGFMAGALRKLWPWKQALETKTIGEETLVLETRNILPGAIDPAVMMAIGLFCGGFVLILLVDHMGTSGDARSDRHGIAR